MTKQEFTLAYRAVRAAGGRVHCKHFPLLAVASRVYRTRSCAHDTLYYRMVCRQGRPHVRMTLHDRLKLERLRAGY